MIVDTLEFKFYNEYILKKLGNTYPEFFLHLGMTLQEIQVARCNHNQNADGTMLELWNK